MPAEELPRRIGLGVKVKTKKSPSRHGIVEEGTGQRQWKVRFNDTGEAETLLSSQLTIDKAAYGHAQPSSPPKSVVKAIKKAVAQTGRKLRSARKKTYEISSSGSDDDEGDGSEDNSGAFSGSVDEGGGSEDNFGEQNNGGDDSNEYLETPRPMTSPFIRSARNVISCRVRFHSEESVRF